MKNPSEAPSPAPSISLSPTSLSPTSYPSLSPSSKPSSHPSGAPSRFPSEAPSGAPSPGKDVPTVAPSSFDVDVWSIVRNEKAEAQVSVGEEPKLFASVEMQYIFHNADQAKKAEVFIYPHQKCGDGAASLLGSSEVISTTDSVLAEDQVFLNATFPLDDLVALKDTIWDMSSKKARFCGRVALYESSTSMLISYHDTNIELLVDLVTGFTAVDMDSTTSNPNSLVRNYSFQVSSCLCEDYTNACYDTLSPFEMGSSIRVCIFPPADQNVEIEKIYECELRQEDTNITRYAFLNGAPDGLSSVETVTPEVYALRTTLDARFFEEPNKVSVFGFVLMKPTGNRRLQYHSQASRDAIRRLEPSETVMDKFRKADNVFLNEEDDSIETGGFRLKLELVPDNVLQNSKEPWKVAFAVVVITASLAAVASLLHHHRKIKAFRRLNTEASGLV
ncbi:MAG: hypothetical protein SGILL_004244 [Bacillariaceae sp.]